MGLGHGSSIVRSGLVLHLDAANKKSYPGTGTAWNDLSGKNNNATLNNAPTFSNNRLYFNGTDESAVVTYDATDFTFGLEQTIFIVLSPTESDGNRRNPYDQSYGGSGTWTHEPGGTITFFYGQSVGGGNGTPYTAYSSSVISQNETACVATVRSVSGNFRRWYKNGIVTYNENNAVYNPVSNSTNNITIGNGYAGYYMGYIDMVLVYNISLTDAQIRQNFEAIRGRYNI